MAMAVWKFPLAVDDHQAIMMPDCAKVLHVGVQNDAPYVWALCRTDDIAQVPYRFRTVGTGHAFADARDWRHVGSYMLHNGALVFHVFAPSNAGRAVMD